MSLYAKQFKTVVIQVQLTTSSSNVQQLKLLISKLVQVTKVYLMCNTPTLQDIYYIF